ncbi:hypothetical protein SAMN02745172_01959 [Pseudoxanthobacter soli DSM 19599]|uniref:Uncharacterized protein n=1 Tax=Pseudoxanthobacter soli DSM 19599 TaxID=1123029 RepID=A0A1M7ZJT8_9HYPH|nr:hypothetical protein [Pseudoxanthobacter soli]SHO65069.1 hypothetical protein SAMN02745172_01959 [Pseudoxanthobacter soli DSM 19599]
MRAAFHLDTAPRRAFAGVVVAVMATVSAQAVSAQPASGTASTSSEITINKPGTGGYVGPYGQSLPGVFMNQGQPSRGPDPLKEFGSPYSWVAPLPIIANDANPTPWTDEYHGQVGPGVIPF